MGYKHLLISWFHFVHKSPLSFPMLKDGKLAGQKNFNAASKELCVEVMDEEIESMHKHTRCLHIFLAKIQKLEEKPIPIDNTEPKENENKKEDDKNDKDEENNAEESKEKESNAWVDG